MNLLKNSRAIDSEFSWWFIVLYFSIIVLFILFLYYSIIAVTPLLLIEATSDGIPTVIHSQCVQVSTSKGAHNR